MKATTLFDVLEDKLRQAKAPLTCNDLVGDADVQRFTSSATRVSDYLGALWRKKIAARVPNHTKSDPARWAYELRAPFKAAPSKKHRTDMVSVPMKGRPNIEVFENPGDKSVVIELANFVVTIRSK